MSVAIDHTIGMMSGVQGVGHTSRVLAQRSSMDVMSNARSGAAMIGARTSALPLGPGPFSRNFFRHTFDDSRHGSMSACLLGSQGRRVGHESALRIQWQREGSAWVRSRIWASSMQS